MNRKGGRRALSDDDSCFLDVEKKLDDALNGEHYDSIKDHVNPRILSSCETNALFKAFEVRCFLFSEHELFMNKCLKSSC